MPRCPPRPRSGRLVRSPSHGASRAVRRPPGRTCLQPRTPPRRSSASRSLDAWPSTRWEHCSCSARIP
eukprot:976931-Rhodomonas_salina.1